MALALLGMRLVEWIFFIGIIGSAVVVLITFVEDIRELLGRTEHTVSAIDEHAAAGH